MGFSCNGQIFSNLLLDYNTDNQLLASIEAAYTWDEETEAKITAKMGGKTIIKETIKVCDYISQQSSTNCGKVGTIKFDLSSRLPGGATSQMMETMITTSNIKIKAKPNGSYEECTKATLVTAYQSASPMGSAGKTAGFVVGAVALVGLAAAVKRRRRSTSNKNNSDNSRRLFGEGEIA